MITPDQLAMLDIMGSDMLREYRDAIITVLAKREQYSPNVARRNVQIALTHRPDLGNHNGYDPGAYITLKEFVLHPGELARADGVLINRESTRNHLWIEARWL